MQNQTHILRVNKRYFQGAIKERETTQRQLAEDMGLDPSALSLVLSNKRKLQLDEASEMARLLGLPLAEVLRNAGIEPPKAHPVPIRGWVDAQGDIHYFAAHKGGMADCPTEMPDGSMAFQCRTAMSPLEYMDGWMLFTPPAGHGLEKSPEALNRLCVMQLAEGGSLLGFMKRGYSTGRYSVHIGARVETDVRLEWAVPVKLAVLSA